MISGSRKLEVHQALCDATGSATRLWRFLDFEATGLDPTRDEIIEWWPPDSLRIDKSVTARCIGDPWRLQQPLP